MWTLQRSIHKQQFVAVTLAFLKYNENWIHVTGLFGRRFKTQLPLLSSLLKTPGSENTAKQLRSRKERREQYYNWGTKELEPLRAGDTVHIKLAMGEIRWTKATVQDQVNIRSYNKPRKISTQESSLPKKNAWSSPIDTVAWFRNRYTAAGTQSSNPNSREHHPINTNPLQRPLHQPFMITNHQGWGTKTKHRGNPSFATEV